MQINVDLDVFKALTLALRDESDTYGEVIRRLLNLADIAPRDESAPDGLAVGNRGFNEAKGVFDDRNGAWMGNVFFPNGTQFRATYKGRTFRAHIRNERWLGDDGQERHSPSEAASAISGTSVNGWRFWYAKRPHEEDWHRLDEFRK